MTDKELLQLEYYAGIALKRPESLYQDDKDHSGVITPEDNKGA